MNKGIMKKILICGASIVMMASLSSGMNNISAKRVHHHTRISRVTRRRSHKMNYRTRRQNQFNNIKRYLNWAKRTHRTNTWKFKHLNRYMNYLSRNQKKQLLGYANRIKRYSLHVNTKVTKRTRRNHKRVNRKHNHKVNHKVNARRAMKHNHHKANSAKTNNNNKKSVNNNLRNKNISEYADPLMLSREADANSDRSMKAYQAKQREQEQQQEDQQNAEWQAQQDAQVKKLEAEHVPYAWNGGHNPMSDYNPFAGYKAVDAKVVKDPGNSGYPMVEQTFKDGTKYDWLQAFDISFPSNSLRNGAYFLKFAKAHPQLAHNWLMHQSNYDLQDTGSVGDVGHDFSPMN